MRPSIAAAIQQLLDQALAMLEINDLAAGQLLRVRFVCDCVQGAAQQLPAATDGCADPALDQCVHQAVQQLATLITQLNRASAQRLQTARFTQRQPVVGLERQAAQIYAQLSNPQAPIIVVAGAEGLGKTTLARLVAARCASDDSFAGVLWSDARQIESDRWAGHRSYQPAPVLNQNDLLLDLASELDIDWRGDPAMLCDEVQAHCALSRYLIVIDNLETSADVAALSPLIQQLVGTSRLLLVTRDQSTTLPAPWPSRQIRLDELDVAASSALLRLAACWTGASGLAQASDAELAELYAAVGGHPLALWLIAGQAKDQPWPRLLQTLIERQATAGAGSELYDQLYRYVWSRLSAPAQKVLFAMHRCSAGAEHELLFELSALDRVAFRAALDELEGRMLVSFDSRYTIHRLTYTFLRVVIAGW